MAKAFKCDLCGKLEEVGPAAVYSLISPIGVHYMENLKIPEQHEAELCVRCLHKLTRTKSR